MSQKPWAQLVSIVDINSDPIQVVNNKCSIGRSKDNDICLVDNRFVSSHHCFIEREESTGAVWLHDTSTNGTLLNATKKMHGQKVQLRHGDEIFIVYQKDNIASNLAYVYQDTKELLREEELSSSPRETSILSNCTLPYDATIEDVTSDIEIDSHGSEDPTAKKPKLDCRETERAICSRTETIEAASSCKPTEMKQVTESPSETEESGKTESVEIISPDGAPGTLKDSTNLLAKEEVSGELQHQTAAFKTDGLEDSLLCSICQDILHNCISLQPCMHSYCAGCYSEWMSKSHDCPSCRRKVERINTNHIVNNLVEAFCKANPDKKRPDEELKMLDAKYHQMKHLLDRDIQPEVNDQTDTDDNDDEAGLSSDSSDIGVYIQAPRNMFQTGSGFLPVAPIDFGVMRPMKTICRQCPEYNTGIGSACCSSADVPSTSSASVHAGATHVISSDVPSTSSASVHAGATHVISSDVPSTSSASVHTGATHVISSDVPSTSSASVYTGATHVISSEFSCSPNQTHLLCFCCLQPMPDRRADHGLGGVVIPPQNCAVCRRIFCHMYWGCKRLGCHGCLAKFKEIDFGREVLAGLILENPYESDIFKDYLDSHQASLKDLLSECCARLAAGSYTCSDQHLIANGESIVCFECGRRNFSDLAYQYRRDIPQDELRDGNRTNCYWGRNCRTQKNKPLHAQKFNHVCEQSRTHL